MMLKIDLEMAFDRLEWSFIHDMLLFFNFPTNLVRLIMSCTMTSSISILINGSPAPSFQPSRGIRQGDPLSPYIFILCMERLSRRIDWAVDYLLWSPVNMSPRGPQISHHLFADDIVLSAQINETTCRTITNVLTHFGSISGQQINYFKSKNFFFTNTSSANKLLTL